MALADYPKFTIKWDSGLKPQMLQALGNLAVVSAQAEELLHQIYWNHAELNERTGPIVTDNLNPKRLQEDIIKLVSLDKTKVNILSDLRLLFVEFKSLNTRRNHCLHWIWTASEEARGGPLPLISLIAPTQSPPYQLKRPIYRQSGILKQELSIEDVMQDCRQYNWLSYRLRSHSFSDDQLRQKRQEMSATGEVIQGSDTMSLADLFWPAPWLDKPLPPDSTPSSLPEIQK